MSDKQTRCPNCLTIYKVTVLQLTVAEGMVCCPKCSTEFNALLHLYTPAKDLAEQPLIIQSTIDQKAVEFEEAKTEHHQLDIFERKTTNSNITLKTYLNNLNTYNHEPINTFPVLNLSSTIYQPTKTNSGKRIFLIPLILINIVLIFVLLFQVFWFNPKYLNQSQALKNIFVNVCDIFQCKTVEEQYTYIHIQNVKITKQDKTTLFSGQLVNHYQKGLKLPLLKVELINHGQIIATYLKQPDEYLVESLNGIARIPQNSPFKFEFRINNNQRMFDNYKLEVIRP